MWNAATRREFNIGVQAEKRPAACDFAVEAQTVKAVAELDARIVLTVYAPE